MSKRLLAVFAHPDDEGAVAGTLARSARQGHDVALICATRGESGEISDPTLATPENLGEVREQELRCACEVIGISQLHLLDYCDSGMIGTPENERPTAFVQADPDEVRFKLVKLIRSIRPDALITFEPGGWYGHPDHIAAGRYATEAYHLAGEPQALPAAGPPWQAQRLLQAVFLRSDFKMIADYAREHGIETTLMDQIPLDEPDQLANQITHSLDVADHFDIKESAMDCHKTQFGEDDLFKRLPPEMRRKVLGREHFIQVHPKPVEGIPITSSIFD